MSGDDHTPTHDQAGAGRTPSADMRRAGERFCSDCPDHEACATAYPCELVRRIALWPHEDVSS